MEDKLYRIKGTPYLISEGLVVYSELFGERKVVKPNNNIGTRYVLSGIGGSIITAEELLDIAKKNIDVPEDYLEDTTVHLEYEKVIKHKNTGVFKRERSSTYEALLGIGEYSEKDEEPLYCTNVLGLGHYTYEDEAENVFNRAIEELKKGTFDYENYRPWGFQ